MARITLEEFYRGDRYGVMGEATKEYLLRGPVMTGDEQTEVEMLLVKHTLLLAEQLKQNGDQIIFTDDEAAVNFCPNEERK